MAHWRLLGVSIFLYSKAVFFLLQGDSFLAHFSLKLIFSLYYLRVSISLHMLSICPCILSISFIRALNMSAITILSYVSVNSNIYVISRLDS